MNDPKVDALSKVPLFASLSKHELGFVASRADEVDAPAGKFLTTQGEPGDTFYVLLDGEARVDIDGELRRTLVPGDFFGEISMLDRGLGTATITTTKPSRLLVMSHAQFRDAIKANDALLIKVLAAMGERLRADLAVRHEHA
ncbi:MAG TPA: cyclic nucleotide-binding domain-containing protein [Candidatus Eisenbacteria bacterium]|nr:cyclic nucleotide-binding domain-containing protein [Candidatus Eisenbacteria bacterium]